jgi:hypothetical protein
MSQAGSLMMAVAMVRLDIYDIVPVSGEGS